jgi:hypothetical protein
MDRRQWLGIVGGCGVGAACGATPARADDGHGAGRRDESPLMAPVAGIHAHFCGIHVAKNNPKFQLIAQHYCAPHGDEMHQCLLYDSCEKNAKLLGVEYIISDRMYRALPEDEKRYWHPHTYEVLAGGLIAPGMTPADELAFMKAILTTWGKTWHTWPDPKTPVPLGEPLLMWSLGADDQVDQSVVAARDALFDVSTPEIRAARVKAFGYEVPRVAFPRSLDQAGRQWTDSGEDKPTPVP